MENTNPSGKSVCASCGSVLDDAVLACSVCYACPPFFPWQAVGETIVIGSNAAQAGSNFIRIGCGAPQGEHESSHWIGCRADYDHKTEKVIETCAEGVSRAHASITPLEDGTFLVRNLSQTNPTRVDFEIVPPEGLKTRIGQRVIVGQWDFVLGLQWPPAGFRRGTWRLPLRGLTVKARGKQLLDNISIVVERAELVALLGPSGAGKTTLLYALAKIKLGRDQVVEGDDLARFWGSLGYVPQDDITHADLTVEQALYYACRLRLPAGTTTAEIRDRIEWALKEVRLTGNKRTRIGGPEEKTLSGGERRRVSLAVALVTNPQVLILDEPTSGLSWTDAARVVDCLKRLAENRNGPGRTVIVTIHQPDVREYDKFHQVAILAKQPRSTTGARLAFFGPPGTSYAFFHAMPGRPPEIFGRIDGPKAEHADAIADRFKASTIHETFVAARLRKDLTEAAQKRGDPPPRPSWLRQFVVLLSRLCVLRIARWRGLALLLAVALALGGLSTLGKSDRQHNRNTFGCDPQKEGEDTCARKDARPGSEAFQCKNACSSPSSIVKAPDNTESEKVPDGRAGLLSTLMAVFLPLLVVSAGSLVSERTIFRNESIAGVRTGPYLLARFCELFIIGNAFMAIVIAIAVRGLEIQGSLATYLEAGVGVVSGAISLGLLISACVPRAEMALWAINLVAIPQILFSGAHAQLIGLQGHLSHLTVTRPAMEAMIKIDLQARGLMDCQIQRYLRLWPGYSTSLNHPLRDLAYGLVPFTVVCLLGAYVALRLRQWRERRF